MFRELVHMTFEKSKELIFEELAKREKNKKTAKVFSKQ